MKKKTKVNKKKLDSLLLILLLTAVLLIMSTYAWFTANRTVKIDSIDVEVATSSGLQISADGITWKTVLAKKDIVDAYQTYPTSVNQLPSLMAPVSSAMEVDPAGHLKMFFGGVEADLEEGSATYGQYLLTSKLQTDVASNTIPADNTDEWAKGYYIAFDVFLKVDQPTDTLYMSGSVIDTTTDDKETATDATSKGLENAARVALIKGANATTTADTATVQALSTAGGTTMLWEPNKDAHTKTGVSNYTSLLWDAEYGITLNEGKNNTQLPYDGLKTEFENMILGDALASKHADNLQRVTPDYASTKDEMPSFIMKDGLASGITKYRIYMWIEGQDVDCENNASGTNVFYDLKFSLDPFVAGGGTVDPDPGP